MNHLKVKEELVGLKSFVFEASGLLHSREFKLTHDGNVQDIIYGFITHEGRVVWYDIDGRTIIFEDILDRVSVEIRDELLFNLDLFV